MTGVFEFVGMPVIERFRSLVIVPRELEAELAARHDDTSQAGRALFRALNDRVPPGVRARCLGEVDEPARADVYCGVSGAE